MCVGLYVSLVIAGFVLAGIGVFSFVTTCISKFRCVKVIFIVLSALLCLGIFLLVSTNMLKFNWKLLYLSIVFVASFLLILIFNDKVSNLIENYCIHSGGEEYVKFLFIKCEMF